MKQGSASRARSPGSGLRAGPGSAPCGTPATNGFAGSLEPKAFTGSLFGAVCPGRGVAAGLILPPIANICANTEAMNLHLAEIAAAVAPGARLFWSSMVPDGTAARTWSSRRTSRHSLSRPRIGSGAGTILPNSPRLQTSGNTCAPTSSPTPSSTATPKASTNAPQPGTSSRAAPQP